MFGAVRRLASLFVRKVARPDRRKDRFHARPRVEALEDRTVPYAAIALTDANSLLSFDTASPNVTGTALAVTGMTAGDVLRGIDRIPNTSGAFARDTLFGVATDAANTLFRVYTINTTTGAATLVATAADGDVTDGALGWGVDFNPTNLLLRVTNNLNNNFSVNPVAGTVTPNTALNPGDPDLAGSAYDRNDTSAGTGTTLFGIDFTTDRLVIQGGVNAGVGGPGGGIISQVGGLGVDTDENVGFDIVGTGNGPGVNPDGPGFAALRVGAVSQLYAINLGTGAATLVGSIGTGATIIRGLSLTTDVPAPPLVLPTGLNIAPFLGLQGSRVAFGDVNGDGAVDRIVGFTRRGRARVQVFSGATGALLRDFRPFGNRLMRGVFVAAADVNGDHFADIIVGPGALTFLRQVRIFNGQTGGLLDTVTPSSPRSLRGVAVGAGDVNNDGRPDIITKVNALARVHFAFFNGPTRASLFQLQV